MNAESKNRVSIWTLLIGVILSPVVCFIYFMGYAFAQLDKIVPLDVCAPEAANLIAYEQFSTRKLPEGAVLLRASAFDLSASMVYSVFALPQEKVPELIKSPEWRDISSSEAYYMLDRSKRLGIPQNRIARYAEMDEHRCTVFVSMPLYGYVKIYALRTSGRGHSDQFWEFTQKHRLQSARAARSQYISNMYRLKRERNLYKP